MWNKIRKLIAEGLESVEETTQCSNCRYCNDQAIECFSTLDLKELSNDITTQIQNIVNKTNALCVECGKPFHLGDEKRWIDDLPICIECYEHNQMESDGDE